MHAPTISRWMWAYLIGGMAGRSQGGTQQVGGPVGVSWEWAMTHGPFSLIPLSWPQLMPLPPHAMLAALTQPCKFSYKHDENQPTPHHSKHNDHPNVNPPLTNTTLRLWLTAHENIHETTWCPRKPTNDFLILAWLHSSVHWHLHCPCEVHWSSLKEQPHLRHFSMRSTYCFMAGHFNIDSALQGGVGIRMPDCKPVGRLSCQAWKKKLDFT